MEIKPIRLDDQLTHIALVGRLDLAGMQGNDIKMTGYTASRRKPTIIDMSALEFIGSLGIGVLVAAAQTLKRHNAKVAVLQPNEMVEKALRTVGLDQDIGIVHDLDSALRYVGVAS